MLKCFKRKGPLSEDPFVAAEVWSKWRSETRKIMPKALMTYVRRTAVPRDTKPLEIVIFMGINKLKIFGEMFK